MDSQLTEEQWGLVYYRKKTQFNQYLQFKAKSFQYQKLLGNLHYLSNENNQNQKKQIKQYIKSLNSTMNEIRNIFSQIEQQMKFLKIQNLALLVEAVQELITSIHQYTTKTFKNKIQNRNQEHLNDEDFDSATCKKCLGSINQLNLKKLYDQITTTQTTVQDQSQKMTQEDRRKMISQLDDYDILIAEKDNYLRKVNAVLENKGKVGELSEHDKTFNFLSEYLATIQKIQEKRKSYLKNKDQNKQELEREQEQESYKHILTYVKQVLFEHFMNECSGPVKKLFQKVNIDKLFKSFDDHVNEMGKPKSQAVMKNHQTQTTNIPEIQQLKMIERKMEFKTKEISMLKLAKQELEKKYISTLDTNRKVESQMFETKKQKRWYESEMKVAQQNVKKLNEKYQLALSNYQQDQRRTIERFVNEKQKILKASKILQADFITLQEEHKKCMRSRNVAKSFSTSQTQTYFNEFPDQFTEEQYMMLMNGQLPTNRRNSKINRMLFVSANERKAQNNGKGIALFEAYQTDANKQKDQNKNQTKFLIQNKIVNLIIYPSLTDENKDNHSKETKKSLSKQKTMTKLKKQKPQLRQNDQKSTKKFLTQGDEMRHSGKSNKKLKMSMKSFKKQKQQPFSQLQNSKLNPYKFSIFNNRSTEVDDAKTKSLLNNITPESDNDNGLTENKNQYMASQRLYSQRKKKQQSQIPFQRVIENGKEKFYIKKISRESINYKMEKQKIKEISQILKPYVYNSNLSPSPPKKIESRKNIKNLRHRLSYLGQRRLSTEGKQTINHQIQMTILENQEKNEEKSIEINEQPPKNIGQDIIAVKNIVQSQYAYLKAVGFIQFLMKIGKENKKVVKAINKIQKDVRQNFKQPAQSDLELFGGKQQAEDYLKGKNFWTLDDIKENMMVYNKNDGMSLKVQKYFNLLKRANPELYMTLIRFLVDPILAVTGKKTANKQNHMLRSQDPNFIRDLFNQLQKYHKIRHNECTHIYDFLEKIGFYKYTYF